MPNKREVTERVLKIIATESYVNDERLGLLLLKERDLEQAMKILSFLITRSNENEASFVDPNLFSVCVKNTTMKEDVFASLVHYMNANQVPVTTDFLMNAFTAMATDRTNLNALLDIINELSQEDGQLPGTVWRQLMRRINGDIEEKLLLQQSGRVHSNRQSLLMSLFQSLLGEESTESKRLLFDSVSARNRKRFETDLPIIEKVMILCSHDIASGNTPERYVFRVACLFANNGCLRVSWISSMDPQSSEFVRGNPIQWIVIAACNNQTNGTKREDTSLSL